MCAPWASSTVTSWTNDVAIWALKISFSVCSFGWRGQINSFSMNVGNCCSIACDRLCVNDVVERLVVVRCLRPREHSSSGLLARCILQHCILLVHHVHTNVLRNRPRCHEGGPLCNDITYKKRVEECWLLDLRLWSSHHA